MVSDDQPDARERQADEDNAACLKDDKGQWLIVAINRFNHATFEDFDIREEQRRWKSNDGDAILRR